MKAYSVDFRKKIVETYESEKISQAKLAKRFNVAKSFVQKLLKQWRETGNLEPRRSSGGQKLKLSSSQIICVGDWVSEKNDITLKEIKKRLEEQEKVKVMENRLDQLKDWQRELAFLQEDIRKDRWNKNLKEKKNLRDREEEEDRKRQKKIWKMMNKF